MQNSKKIELLSPAKNIEFGKTAINFGADAVYIGATKFGARTSARNSIDEIEKLCSYAHKFHSKVYVTLNTILFENELIEAEKIITQICEAGADALIIQDMGILEMKLPPIPIHASTQAHNIDYRKINFYDKVGISRVILARELSLDKIKEIKQNTNIQLEAFIHGALCVSYSGQCYMSAYIGNRSGNRGECAQTCRLKYDLLDSDKNMIVKDKHLLSIKDMNRSTHILEMIEAGINSFKIEGRLKDLNYLKNITAHYRKIFDKIFHENNSYANSSIGKYQFNFEPDADKTFNRRYTDYFLTERKKGLNSYSPKSLGKLLGKVKKNSENYIIIDTKEQINNGDGLCFFNNEQELTGFSVNKTQEDKIYTNSTNQINLQTPVYRNNDHEFNKKIASIETGRYIPINIKISETENGFELFIETEKSEYSVSQTLISNKEIAKNPEKAIQNIKTQLSKTGNTVFKIKNIELEISKAFFIPTSEINKIRRNTLEELYSLLGSKFIREEKTIVKNDFKYYSEKLDYKSNISNSLSEKFYKRHGVTQIEKAFELSSNKKDKTLMTTKMCLKYNFGMCEKYQKATSKPNPKYLRLNNEVFNIEFDCKNCQMNIKS